MRSMKIIIDGPDVTVDVMGEKGKRCLDVTKFLERISGMRKVGTRHKPEIKQLEVPTELRIE